MKFTKSLWVGGPYTTQPVIYIHPTQRYANVLPGRLGKVVATQNDNLVEVRFDNKITVHNMPIDKLELATC